MGTLAVNLTANSERFNKGMKSATARLKRFRKAAITAVKGGVVAGVGGAVAGIVTLKKQMSDLDDVAKLAGRTGFDSATIAGFGFAAEQSGSSVQNANKALDQFTRRMGDAADGSGASAEAMKKMGLSVEEMITKSPEDQLFAVANAIQELPTAALRADAAYQMFGRSGQELVNVLATGASGIKAFQSEADTLGLGFDNEELAKVEAANDAMNRITRAIGAIAATAAVELAPVVERFASGMLGVVNSMGGVGDVIGSVIEFISTAWNVMTNAMATAITATMAVGEWAVTNWRDIGEIAFKGVALQAVTAFNQIVHFFSDVLPAVFQWFSKNWHSIFFTAFDFVATGFINLGKNIRNIWGSIMDYITGKTSGLEFTWTPMLDGFRSAVSKLPDIPERAIGALEQSLSDDVNALGDKLGKSFDATVTARLNTLSEMQALKAGPVAESITTTPDVGKPPNIMKDSDDTSTGTSGTTAFAGIAQRGSAEAFSQIISAMQGGESPQEKLQKKGNKNLEQIAKNTAKNDTSKNIVLVSAGAV